MQNAQNISLFPILLVNFIGTLGFSIVIPFLVFLVADVGGNAFIYGLLVATYSIFQLIGAPILGRWSDHYGRRKILLLSQVGTALAWTIFLAALYLPRAEYFSIESGIFGSFVITLPLIVLFIARMFDGITGGNVSVANAYLADITADEDRSKNYGKMSASANLGFVIGPALAGVLGATLLGVKLPVIVALLVSIIAIFFIIFRLKESKSRIMTEHPDRDHVRKVFGQEHKDCYQVEAKHDLSMRGIFRLKYISFFIALYFLIFLGFNFFYVAFPIHAITVLDWSITKMGIFFGFMSLAMVIVQGPILARLSKKYSDTTLIIIGNVILGTGFLLFLFSTDIIIYSAALAFAIGNGIMWPSFLSKLSKVAGETYQGSVQGLASSAGSLASIFGLILGGLLYVFVGGWLFLVSAVIIYIAFFLSFRLPSMQHA